jgi:hypothetical protein
MPSYLQQNVRPYAPAVLKPYIGALFPDFSTYVFPTGLFAGVNSRPAKPGETIVFYGIGFAQIPGTPPGTVPQVANGLLSPHETRPWEEVCADLNARLRGWQNYFSYGAMARSYATINRYVYDRVRYFLRRRHTTTHSRGTRQFSDQVVFGRWGLLATALLKLLRVHVMKSVGKADAGKPHVRFDERGTETGLLLNEPHPRRSSTLTGISTLAAQCPLD